jgi:hypothetical protein
VIAQPEAVWTAQIAANAPIAGMFVNSPGTSPGSYALTEAACMAAMD